MDTYTKKKYISLRCIYIKTAYNFKIMAWYDHTTNYDLCCYNRTAASTSFKRSRDENNKDQLGRRGHREPILRHIVRWPPNSILTVLLRHHVIYIYIPEDGMHSRRHLPHQPLRQTCLYTVMTKCLLACH